MKYSLCTGRTRVGRPDDYAAAAAAAVDVDEDVVVDDV